MLLLTGPAGSGKTHRILEDLRTALRRRDSAVRLLTPTTTLSQHLQNRMAHEGFVFRPSLIQTLSHFVDALIPDLPQVSEPLLYLIVEEAARRANRREFADVVHLPGFSAALTRTVDELYSAGCDAERLAGHRSLAELGDAFLAVFTLVDIELRRRGLFTRSQRLMRAAETVARDGMPARTIWLDGFSALPDPELALIRAISARADITLTLLAAPATEPTRQRLLAMGFQEERCAFPRPQPRIALIRAASIEREADEIARLILDQSAGGRPFRDVGVVVRSADNYELLLRATFDRFGIPARFYFDGELAGHRVARYLAGIVDALLGGWDHAATLAAIRLGAAFACDEFDFAVRAQSPGRGLAALADLPGAPVELLDSLAALDGWLGLTSAPLEWAARLHQLRALFPLGQPEPGSYEWAAIARSQAVALDEFDAVLDQAAHALDDRPIPLTVFWRAAKSILRLTLLRIPDARRNVVHVLSAHEARQWSLPVVFVCGLVEKQFPQFHTQDPFFPEAARVRLNQAGIRLRTAVDFETEERFLFDCAITRATDSLVLSYPRFDARAQQNLPSLYLEGLSVEAEEPRTSPVQNLPARISAPQAVPSLPIVFSPSALESYLQCAFQYFGRYTMRLKGAPARPDERLDFLLQGNIVHEVLNDLHRNSAPIDETFDRVFERTVDHERLPRSYRTAALRERMLADLRALLADPDWKTPYEIRAEQKFQLPLAPDIEIKGRIDRINVTPDGRGYVIDYKYSGAANTKSRATDENLLQPQLYMLALERCFDLRPEAMAYLGFKGGIEHTAWIPYAPGPAVAIALRIVDEIRAGNVTPLPADPDKCRFCDFRDVCRYTAEAARAEGAPA